MGTNKDVALKRAKIGQLLIEARHDTGVGQIELSEILGISQSTISKIENGGSSRELKRLINYYVEKHGYDPDHFKVELDQFELLSKRVDEIDERMDIMLTQWQQINKNFKRLWENVDNDDPG